MRAPSGTHRIRTLPLRIPPVEGESFVSYVERLAHDLHVPVRAVLQATGILYETKSSALPGGYGTVLTHERLKRFCFASDLPTEVVSSMLLSHFHGVCCDLSVVYPGTVNSLAIDYPYSYSNHPPRQWIYGRNSHVCPACLAASPTWKLAWKLPWSFACIEHQALLVDTCPGCGGSTGRYRSNLPTWLGHIRKLTTCLNPMAADTMGKGGSSNLCNLSLRDLAPLSLLHSPRIIEAQIRLNNLLCGATKNVLTSLSEEPVSPFDYFSDIRSLCALIIPHGALECLKEEEPVVIGNALIQAGMHHSAVKNTRSGRTVGGLNPNKGWWYRAYASPPRSAALVAAVVPRALEILDADSSQEIAERLEPIVKCVRMRIKDVDTARALFRISPRLDAPFRCAWEWSGGYTIFGTAIGMARTQPSSIVQFPPDYVPQLFWREEFEAHFTDLFQGMTELHVRQLCSVALLRLGSNLTWKEAAEMLGWPPAESQSVADRAVCVLLQNDKLETFSHRLTMTAHRIAKGSDKTDYGSRRRALSSLTEISVDDWSGICNRVGASTGSEGIRRRFAATWIWCQLTEGYYRLSPALKPIYDDKASNIGSSYRRFVRSQMSPDLEKALLEYGHSLLAEGG